MAIKKVNVSKEERERLDNIRKRVDMSRWKPDVLISKADYCTGEFAWDGVDV